MNWQLAWRNIWRNPRRTAVILTAVVVGVWSMIFSNALVRGLAEQMVRTGISTLTGHIQVHARGYRNDPVIENSVKDPDLLFATLRRTLPAGARWAARLRVEAVAGNARHSTGVTLVGIDPAGESGVSFIPGALAAGSYLDPARPTGILVGKALAEQFETRLGYKLILLSQDTSKEIASRAFRIVGVFRADQPSVESRFVFVNLTEAREMLAFPGGVSEVGIVLKDTAAVDAVASSLRSNLPARDFEVHTWRELLPLVTASVTMYNSMIWLWNLVAFVAMGFGLVNTLLMAVLERTREFGLLRALGMKPGGIVKGVLTESAYLLLIGMALGNLLGYLSVLALSAQGLDLSTFAAGMDTLGMPRVIFPTITLPDALLANGIVLGLGLLASFYPAARATRITPVQAMARTE